MRLVDEQHGDPHPVEVGDRRILRRVRQRSELFDELLLAAFDDALGVTRQGAGVVVGGEVIEAAWTLALAVSGCNGIVLIAWCEQIAASKSPVEQRAANSRIASRSVPVGAITRAAG